MNDVKQMKIAENKHFITFMKLAREEPDIRERMIAVLSLDSFNRKSLLNTWLRDLKLQGAPVDYIEALSFFLDNAGADKALQVILEYQKD